MAIKGYILRKSTEEEVDSFINKALGELLKKSLKELDTYLEGCREETDKSFLKLFDNLFHKCYQMQVQEEKAEICYLHIFCLKSALLTGKYELQIDLFSKWSYFDNEECYERWVPEVFIKYFEADLAAFKGEAGRNLRGFSYSSYQEIRLHYYDIYLVIILRYVIGKIPEILNLPSFERLEKADDFKIIFGGYMDKGIQLYPFGEVAE